MAGNGFLPDKDAALATWSAAFSSLINATPTAYGLTAPQATAYATLNTAFAAALATSTNESTRTKGSIAAKNTARTNLKVTARNLAGIIEHTPTVTDEQKLDLGLNVRKAPSPIPAPSAAPALDVISTTAWTVLIKLHDSTVGSKRGKPAGVIGASVFSFVGATPPSDMGSWKFEGSTGQTKVQISFANTNPPGTKVWLTAFWFNPRKQSGPACAPVSANLPGGSVSMAA